MNMGYCNCNGYHEFNLDWIISTVKEVLKDWDYVSHEWNETKKYLEDFFKNLNFQDEVNNKLNQMLEDGSLKEIIDSVLFKEYAEINMADITPSNIDYIDINTLYNNLITEYGSNPYFRYTVIGHSVNNIPIYDFTVGKGSDYHVLSFGNQHGREYQSVYMLYNVIRYILSNIDDEHTITGWKLSDIFEEVSLHIVLSDNPDVYELIINNDNFNRLPLKYQETIQTGIENYIRGGYLEVGTDVTQSEYDNILARSSGDMKNYVFNISELHIWSANLNGVDLHYNCFNANNESTIRAWASQNNWPDYPAPLKYIGENGFSEPENAAIAALITQWGIRDIIDYHQRGPTMFWAYKYGGELYERNKTIAQDLGRITQTPISTTNSDRVGFAGWFYANYKGFCCDKEIGWSYTEHFQNGRYDDSSELQINPLPRNTLQELYDNEKNALPYYCAVYARKMDCYNIYSVLNKVDVAGHNSIKEPDDSYYLISLQYLLDNYRRTLDTANNDVTLLTLGKTNAVGTRHVMYLGAESYPGIERPDGTPTQAGMLIRESAGTMFFYLFMPIGYNQLYFCSGYSNTIGQWKRIDS